MKFRYTSIAGLMLAGALGWTSPAFAHCDTLDGPVVQAAHTALQTGNVNHVLKWVQPADEAAMRAAFDRARKVRSGGEDARELADHYFFETLVRIHRAGEGAAYTGLKPAGQIEPVVAAADKAIETGRLQPVAKLVTARLEHGLHGHFDQVMAKKKHGTDDVDAGRAYVAAYVEFMHYAERLHEAAAAAGHAGAAPAAPRHAH